MRYILIFAALLLSGCGGHHHNNPAPPPPPNPNPPPRQQLLYGYFGVVGRQLEETADHVNTVWSMDWGDWDTSEGRSSIANRILAELLEARQRGITHAVVATGFCTFNNAHAFVGTEELIKFRQLLNANNLISMVAALYPLDEPDVANVPSSVMDDCYLATKAVWPEAKIAVIYSDRGTPGIEQADWIGTDRYGLDSGVLGTLPPIGATQRWLLVPGGSDPWKNNPSPFYTFALTHTEVAMLVPFVWFDRERDEQGQFRAGIRSNGMANAYRNIGLLTKGIAE